MKKVIGTYETWRPAGPTGNEEALGTAQIAREGERFFVRKISESGRMFGRPRWREISHAEAQAILDRIEHS